MAIRHVCLAEKVRCRVAVTDSRIELKQLCVFFENFEWIFLAIGHILKLLEAADAI